jgi:hypothetical protein
MNGKIGFEERFAIPRTLRDSVGFVSAASNRGTQW